jgi:hypothetical protein
MGFKEKQVPSNVEKKITLDGYEWGFFCFFDSFETDEIFCTF